jgi:hypothetical protein
MRMQAEGNEGEEQQVQWQQLVQVSWANARGQRGMCWTRLFKIWTCGQISSRLESDAAARRLTRITQSVMLQV